MKRALAFCLLCIGALSLVACEGIDEREGTDISEVVITNAASDESSESVAWTETTRGDKLSSSPKPDPPTAGDETDSSFPSESKEEPTMKMQVKDGKHTVTFELNDSPAAKSLYDQLPLTIDVKNYSDNEKIFYPEALDTNGAVNADAKKGTLAYFSPWGDVVMYYKDFGSYNGLYELGEAISGADEIASLSGKIDITAVK